MARILALIEVDRSKPCSYLKGIYNALREVSSIGEIIFGILPECDFDVVDRRLNELVGGSIKLLRMDNALEGLRSVRSDYNPQTILRVNVREYPLNPKVIDKLMSFHLGGNSDMTYAEFEKVLLEAIRSEALDDVVDYTPPLIARARSNYSDRLRVSVYRFDREDKAFYYRDHFKDIYDTPSSYNVEASSRCFLRCRMCTFQREVRRKKTKPFIDWELYKRIVDQIYETRKNKPTSICLIYRGEPLLNRNLAQMVEHASKFGFKVGIASNGILLTKDKARELLRAGLGWIDFSIDAASKDTYDKIRIGGNYDKAVENVENFVSVRDELGSKTEVGLKFVLQELNELEVNAFLDRWIDVVDNVTVQSEIKKDGDGQFGMRALKKNFMPQARPPCSVFWQNMIITTEGLVVPCINSTGEIVLGDVNHNSLYEIWHNEEFVKCRELHLAGRFDELELCRNCDAVLSDMTPYLIEEKNGFSKAIYSCVEVYSKTGKSK